MRLKVSSAKCRPFCLGLNVLTALFSTPDTVYHLAIAVSVWIFVLIIKTLFCGFKWFIFLFHAGSLHKYTTGIIFFVCAQPMRDDVTSSLIGWAHKQNDPCQTTPNTTMWELKMYHKTVAGCLYIEIFLSLAGLEPVKMTTCQSGHWWKFH